MVNLRNIGRTGLLLGLLLLAIGRCRADIEVQLNGQPIPLSVAPYNVNGVTMLPLPDIVNMLAGQMSFDAVNQLIKIHYGNLHVEWFVGDLHGIREDKAFQISTPATMVDTTLMAPLEFFSQILGCNVAVSDDLQTIFFTVPLQPGLLPPYVLDNLLRPYALYPDPLLYNVLHAARFPDQLQMAAQNQYADPSWDSSVRTIASYHTVLAGMVNNITATTQIGQASWQQPNDVNDSIQRLRDQYRDQLERNHIRYLRSPGGHIQIELGDSSRFALFSFNVGSGTFQVGEEQQAGAGLTGNIYWDAREPRLFSPYELDNLLTPVALYPDRLLFHVLHAARFPDQLQMAAQFQMIDPSWNESVRVVANYRTVLNALVSDLDSTIKIGQAAMQQPNDVYDSIQRLRMQYREQLERNHIRYSRSPEGRLQIDMDEPSQTSVFVYNRRSGGFEFGEHIRAGTGLEANINLNWDAPVRRYTVTPTYSEHGSLDQSAPQAVPAGDSVTYIAKPDPGYAAEWYVNDQHVGSGGSYTMRNVAADAKINVRFVARTGANANERYTITPQAGPHGAINQQAPQTVPAGGAVTFTATPEAGYSTEWYQNSQHVGSGNSFTASNVAGDSKVTALFIAHNQPAAVAAQYTIRPSAGPHGSITPSAAQQVAAGKSVTFSAVADAGYSAVWYLDGTPQGSRPTLTLSDVTANHNISVTFISKQPLPKTVATTPLPAKPKPAPAVTPEPAMNKNYTITPSAGAHGTISPDTAQSVKAGNEITFTAKADKGFTVNSWILDTKELPVSAMSYTLMEVKSNHAVEVTFKAIRLPSTPAVTPKPVVTPATANLKSFTITPSAGANGAITPDTAQEVKAGGEITFTAKANKGFTVDTWMIDGKDTRLSAATSTLTNVKTNHTIEVTFKALHLTSTPAVTPKPAVTPAPAMNQSFTITPTAGANGSITPDTLQTVKFGEAITFTAKAGKGYSVDTWLVDGVDKHISTESFTLKSVKKTHAVVVTFKEATRLTTTPTVNPKSAVTSTPAVVKSFTVSPSAGANGTITPDSAQTVKAGEDVTFTAKANRGFVVDSWSVNGVNKHAGTATYTLTNVRENQSVEVTFKEATRAPAAESAPKIFIVTPAAGDNGTISPDNEQKVKMGEDITFTAKADKGYKVDTWSVDGKDSHVSAATYTLKNVRAKHAVKVTFKAE